MRAPAAAQQTRALRNPAVEEEPGSRVLFTVHAGGGLTATARHMRSEPREMPNLADNGVGYRRNILVVRIRKPKVSHD